MLTWVLFVPYVLSGPPRCAPGFAVIECPPYACCRPVRDLNQDCRIDLADWAQWTAETATLDWNPHERWETREVMRVWLTFQASRWTAAIQGPMCRVCVHLGSEPLAEVRGQEDCP